MSQTYYPHFDVLAHQSAWDPNTQAIVTKRIDESSPLQVLNPAEAALLKEVLTHLLYEDRDLILGYVVAHMDRQLANPMGESQRKQLVPAAADLVRTGLGYVDAVARHRHGKPFIELATAEQFAIIAPLQKGQLEGITGATSLPQKECFKKLLGLAVDAYASHPTVWSEIGYAGPAYPRGYYRIELGVTDPWEPVRERSDEESRGGEEDDVQHRTDV